MRALELKVPPPAVAVLVALAMWGLAQETPAVELPPPLAGGMALALLVAGLGFDIAGLLAFLRAHTTINPWRPARTQALVTSGVYRITRNPMYVGLALQLAAWAAFLTAPAALAGPVAFVAYITRFQVRPEERVLLERFGAAYAEYLQCVPRWLWRL